MAKNTTTYIALFDGCMHFTRVVPGVGYTVTSDAPQSVLKALYDAGFHRLVKKKDENDSKTE